MAVPSEWSGTPPMNQRLVPMLGEHTKEVLREIGYSDETIEDLHRRAVIDPGAHRRASAQHRPILNSGQSF